MNESDSVVYVVFSATPTRMGQLIRFATGHPYNHVSLSLSGDIQRMYSFARYYRRVPLYGGFVEESILRYASFAGQARVKICRIPLDARQQTYLRCHLQRLWDNRTDYIYNTPGALTSLLHRSFFLPKTHTCVTFVSDILSRCQLMDAGQNQCPTIHQLELLLADFSVYEGPVPIPSNLESWGQDTFPQETTTRYAVFTTARHFGRLARRAIFGVV